MRSYLAKRLMQELPNAFISQTWEPTIRHLIELSDNPKSGIYIDEIWSFEAVNHGNSVLINEGKLVDVCESCVYAHVCNSLMDHCVVDWMDNSLDILLFIENYIPGGPYIIKMTPLPTLLQCCVSPAVVAE